MSNRESLEPPRWVHHPAHMKGWEAFGVTGDEPTVRRLGSGHDGKGELGTTPWGPGEVKLGVAGIEIHASADYTEGAYIYVVGTHDDAVKKRWFTAEQMFEQSKAALWPARRS